MSSTYSIFSNTVLSRLTPHAEEIVGGHHVDFDETGQIQIMYSAFVKYSRNNRIKMKQVISYL